jgi:hypothetical protein
MIVKDDQALEMACRVKVKINRPKRPICCTISTSLAGILQD